MKLSPLDKPWTSQVLEVKKYDCLTYYIPDSCQFILQSGGNWKFLENGRLITKSMKNNKKSHFARTYNSLPK